MTAHVLMYSTGVCPYCVMAERLLKATGVDDIEKVRIDLDPEQRSQMMEKTGRRPVPRASAPPTATLTSAQSWGWVRPARTGSLMRTNSTDRRARPDRTR